MKAYLDIETSFEGTITVIGIYRPNKGFLQLVGDKISLEPILEFLEGVHTIITYNGSRFDFPMIERCLNYDLSKKFFLYDLLYDCWNFKLYGGLKAVEEALGIGRRTCIDSFDAMSLWARYRNSGDEKALELLLQYNKEDVMNLPLVEKRLLDLYEIDLLPFAREI